MNVTHREEFGTHVISNGGVFTLEYTNRIGEDTMVLMARMKGVTRGLFVSEIAFTERWTRNKWTRNGKNSPSARRVEALAAFKALTSHDVDELLLAALEKQEQRRDAIVARHETDLAQNDSVYNKLNFFMGRF